MFLDYLVIPVVSVVYGALSMQRMVDDLAPGLSNKIVSALGMSGHEQRAGDRERGRSGP